MVVTRRQLALFTLVIVILASGLAAYFVTRPEPTDREKIVALIAQGQRAVAQRNATGLTRLLSRDYYDAYGYTREQLVGMIVNWMRSGQDVQAVPEITDLQIHGDFADVKLRVWLAWGEGRSPGGEPYRMTVRLRREGRTWRVISAEGWGEAQSDIMSGE